MVASEQQASQSTLTAKGYARVHIERPAPACMVKVHRLVLESFVCPRPEGAECRHLNGDPSDNRLANLRWGTSADNKADQRAHGTMSWAKLTDAQVAAIRAEPPKRGCVASAAAELGISTNHLYRILRGARR